MCVLDRERLGLVEGWLADQRRIWAERTDRLERFVTDMGQGTQRLHECNTETSEPLTAFVLMVKVALGKPLRTGRHQGGQ